MCVVSLYWTANFLVANNNYYHAKNSVQRIRLHSSAQTVDNIKAALEQVDSAIKYFPQKASYYLLRAELNEWMARISPDREEYFYRLAFDDFKMALLQRPNWPATWANLAAIKWKLDEVDDEFYNYLKKALKLGPQHEIVHIFVVEYGLATLASYSKEFVKINKPLRRHIALGLKNQLSRDRIIKAIEAYNLQREVCRWMVDEGYSVKRSIPNCVKTR